MGAVTSAPAPLKRRLTAELLGGMFLAAVVAGCTGGAVLANLMFARTGPRRARRRSAVRGPAARPGPVSLTSHPDGSLPCTWS